MRIRAFHGKLAGIILWMIPVWGISQNDHTANRKNLYLGSSIGLNYSKIQSDTIDFDYGTKPTLGVYVRCAIFKTIYLKNSVFYSIKGSTRATPYVNFENTYLDINLVPEWEFSKDFCLQTGVNYAQFLFSQKIKPSGLTKSGISRSNNGRFDSEINLVTGMDVRLHRNVSFMCNYFLPLSSNGTKNVQFALNITLNNRNKKTKRHRIIKDKTKEQITQLKNGVLLVRLKSSGNKLNALIQLGRTEEANALKQERDAENRKIVSAFRKQYNFSDCLFFYNSASGKVRNKQFANIFLNDALMIDSTITPDKNKPVFIAEFAPVERDTVKYFSHSTYEPDGNWNLKEVKHYYGAPHTGFDALIIRDSAFVQLRRPFPFYTRAIFKSVEEHPIQVIFLSFPVPVIHFQNWSYDQTVKKMNKKLHKYYEKCR